MTRYADKTGMIGALALILMLTWASEVKAQCADSDGDGVCDADDICPGLDDRVERDDLNGDGIPDVCAQCDLLENGGFEQFTRGSRMPNSSVLWSIADLPGWTIQNGRVYGENSVIMVDGPGNVQLDGGVVPVWLAEGHNALLLADGMVSTTVPTVAGATYRVGLWVKNLHPQAPPNATQLIFGNNTTHIGQGSYVWQQEEYTWQAEGPETTLSIRTETYAYEASQLIDGVYVIGPNLGCSDTDGDGVLDREDPCPQDRFDDVDGDGICASDDLCPGFDDSVDRNQDGIPDGCEACPGWLSRIDYDGDGEVDCAPTCDIMGDGSFEDIFDPELVQSGGVSCADRVGTYGWPHMACDWRLGWPGSTFELISGGPPEAECPLVHSGTRAIRLASRDTEITRHFDVIAGEPHELRVRYATSGAGGASLRVSTSPTVSSLGARGGEAPSTCGEWAEVAIAFRPASSDFGVSLWNDGEDGSDLLVDSITLVGPHIGCFDADADGVPDLHDACALGDEVDTDGDRVPDACDACAGGDDAADADADGLPDHCDPCPLSVDQNDFDDDGVPDACDACPGHADGDDADGDGVPEGCDHCDGGDDAQDADGDGVPDACDICPLDHDGQDGNADGIADACAPDLTAACYSESLGRFYPDGASAQLASCSWQYCWQGIWWLDYSRPAGAVRFAHPECAVPEEPADTGCSSATVGHRVEEWTSVQTTGTSCGASCMWSMCRNAAWYCEGALPSGVTQFPNAACEGVVREPVGCASAVLGRDAVHGERVQSSGAYCANGQTCNMLVCDDGRWVCDASTSEPGDTLNPACEGIEPCTGADFDGDGVLESCDVCAGHDDGTDFDGDGTPDGCDECPADPSGRLDADGDGVCDAVDLCPGHDDASDADGDGAPDDCDGCPDDPTDHVDSDGDGVCDVSDICAGRDDQADSDEDEVPDGCDACPDDARGSVDSDGDGVCDGVDICNGYDDRVDRDGDGIPDGCERCELLGNGGFETPHIGDVAARPAGPGCDPQGNQGPCAAYSDVPGYGFGSAFRDLTGWYLQVGGQQTPEPGEWSEVISTREAAACAVAEGEQAFALGERDVIAGQIPVVRGERYVLTFSVTSTDGPIEDAMMFDLQGRASGSIQDAIQAAPCGQWTEYRFEFEASGGSVTLAFHGIQPLGPRPVIDAIHLYGAGPDVDCAGLPDADADGEPDDYDSCPGHPDRDDADGDGTPDGCDVCDGGDDSVDGDGDGVPDACDICPEADDRQDGNGDGIADDCAPDLTAACYSASLGRFYPDGASAQLASCSWQYCWQGIWWLDYSRPAGAVRFAHPACEEPANPADTGCWSETLGRRVGEWTSLQTAGVVCGATCMWSMCRNATWYCEGALPSGVEQYPHAACEGVQREPDGCTSAVLGRDAVHGERVQSSGSYCANGQACNMLVCDDGRWVCDGATSEPGDHLNPACEGIEPCTGADFDGDGVLESCDVCDGGDDRVDSDGDGMPDDCDGCPLVVDDGADGDGDGTPDACDVCPGAADGDDADADGTPDGCDVCDGGDDSVDGDGDGVPDACDICPDADDRQDGNGDGIADDCAPDLTAACYSASLGRFYPDGASAQLASCSWQYCWQGIWWLDYSRPAGAVRFAHPACEEPANPADTGCWSATVGHRVEEWTSVQTSHAGECPETCMWSMCRNAYWHCEGALPSGVTQHPNAACEGVVRASVGCTSAVLGRDAIHGERVQSSGSYCGNGQTCNMLVCDDGRWVCDGATSEPGDHLNPACEGIEPCTGADFDGDGVLESCDVCDGGDDRVDSDGDGMPDDCDGCPLDALNDSDGDAVCDGEDVCLPGDDRLDWDGDGAPDACDACPLDVADDSDGDGACDSDDPCPADEHDDTDGDGVCDSADACPGHDDGADGDGDGTADGCDACPADNPNDSDGDGVCDSADTCPSHDDHADADGDGVANGCDACPADNPNDSDGDGVCDSADACPGHDDGADGDGDGTADGCDACPTDSPNDSDGDGVCDSADRCPGQDDRADGDGDGMPDACDVCPADNPDDSDGDGVCDSVDACPGHDDAEDGDGDGVPDFCDTCPVDNPDDSDGDGRCDSNGVSDEGGEVELPAQTTLTIPPGAVAAPVIIEVTAVPPPVGAPVNPANPEAVLEPAGVFLDLGPAGTTFDEPIILRIPFDVQAAADVPDAYLVIVWSQDGETWTQLDTTVDREAGMLEAEVHHFTVFGPAIYDPCPNDEPDDSDGDGVCDSDDACPGYVDADDIDGDGVADGCDPCPLDAVDDSDGDGVCDSVDVCAGHDDGADGDGDGVADGCDACPLDADDDSDGDGVCDSADSCPGHDDGVDGDGDGAADGCDACPSDATNDSDGDGICDSVDACAGHDDARDADGDGVADGCDACPLDAGDDSDGDGVCDSADACPGHDDGVDGDGDGAADGCDACPVDAANDSDGDGICDSVDVCAGHDDAADSDGDGTADGCDVCPHDAFDDADGDTVCGDVDNCAAVANVEQADLDGDAEGDACDLDDDGDGAEDAADNCPRVANPAQSDIDGDWAGDACDEDDDGDGVADPGDNCALDWNPAQTDADHNDVGDVCEGLVCEVLYASCRRERQADDRACDLEQRVCVRACDRRDSLCRQGCREAEKACHDAAEALEGACRDVPCGPAGHCRRAVEADHRSCRQDARDDLRACRQSCRDAGRPAGCMHACRVTWHDAGGACRARARASRAENCREPFEQARVCRDERSDCVDVVGGHRSECRAEAEGAAERQACDDEHSAARTECIDREADCLAEAAAQ